uniref:CPL domain-containing protein n=1 Tax=Hucho hucho TaxID=62062 RepID=A0A4W5R3E2_9TELE
RGAVAPSSPRCLCGWTISDDTKLVKQAILSEILASLPDVITNRNGKKVLLYLLSSRDPAHLSSEIIQVLEKGDGNAHSCTWLIEQDSKMEAGREDRFSRVLLDKVGMDKLKRTVGPSCSAGEYLYTVRSNSSTQSHRKNSSTMDKSCKASKLVLSRN